MAFFDLFNDALDALSELVFVKLDGELLERFADRFFSEV
jgi:hypothetical protein